MDAWPGAIDPDGQASIWYERPGSTVTSDTVGVKVPTVPPVNTSSSSVNDSGASRHLRHAGAADATAIADQERATGRIG
jgi:hypothetical protein